MHDQINSRANTILWVLFAASGLLFVIACSNVANLVLARTVRRESELAVRSALGASTAALRRSLLAESLVLCVSGAIAALLLAVPMVAVLGRYASRFSVRAEGLTLDFTLVWFGIALALIAAVFLAFIPRLPSADPTHGIALTGGGTRVTGRSSRRLRIFAITQIAASFLLLAGAGALLRTLMVLEQTRPPFDTVTRPRHQSAADELWPHTRTGTGVLSRCEATRRRDPRRRIRLRRLQRSLARIPGPRHHLAFAMEGAARQNGDDLRAKFRTVSPGFFETFGVPFSQAATSETPTRTAPNASSSSARASPRSSSPARIRSTASYGGPTPS